MLVGITFEFNPKRPHFAMREYISREFKTLPNQLVKTWHTSEMNETEQETKKRRKTMPEALHSRSEELDERRNCEPV